MSTTDRRTRVLTLAALCLALFMAMTDSTAVTVALPSMQRSLQTDVAGLQWIFTGYTLFFATLMLTGGTLGDLYGRRRLFLLGVAVFSVGTLMCALAPSVWVLVGGRITEGIGAAMLLPGTLSILTNTFPDARERAQAIGIWAGVSAIALSIGPVVGGLLTDTFGWQSIFWMNLPIGALAVGIALRAVPESKDPESRSLDLPGQLLAVGSLGTVTYALIQANDNGWTSGLTIGFLLAAAVLQAAFLLRERRAASPMLPLRYFRRGGFAAGIVVAGMVTFGMFGALFFLTLYIQNIQNYSALGMGLRALPLTIAIVVTAPLAGGLAGRIGSRIPMTVGLVLNGAGMLLLTRISPDMSYWDLWWNLLLLGIGTGLTSTPMTAAVMNAVPRARAGMASATTNASREIGGLLGVALLGALVAGWFATELAERLEATALDAATRAAILDVASRGGRQAVAELGAGIDAAGLQRLIDEAYVAGMMPAIVVSGIVLLLGAVMAWILVPGGPPRQAAAAEPAVATAESVAGGATNPP